MDYGKKWYFITPDYAFGHTLFQGCEADLKKPKGNRDRSITSSGEP